MEKSEKTKPDLDKLKKVCPYAAEAYAYILSEREKFAIAKVTIRDQAMEAIATRMLELAAENEQLHERLKRRKRFQGGYRA